MTARWYCVRTVRAEAFVSDEEGGARTLHDAAVCVRVCVCVCVCATLVKAEN